MEESMAKKRMGIVNCVDMVEKYIDVRFETLEKRDEINADHLKMYYDAQLDSIRESINLASKANDARLNSMNEFRQAMQDQSNKYLTMSEHDVWKEKIESEMNVLRDFRVEISAKASQRGLTWGYIVIAINMFFTIIALVLAYGDKILGI